MGKEAEITWGKPGSPDIVYPRLISIARTGGQRDQIIPVFITTALPRWFGVVFMLSLLSAAMSTLSDLLHAMGTAAGRDVFEQIAKPIGLCVMLTGKTVLWQSPNWPVVDPIVIGLPFSFLLAVVVSLFTRPPDKQLFDRCFS